MLDLSKIESASYAMNVSLSKAGYRVEVTSAPSVDTSKAVNDYRKYIALTQRILDAKDNSLLGYITYRCTQTTSVKHPQFSSYEVLDVTYKPIEDAKFHLDKFPNVDECFKAVYTFIKKTFSLLPF